MGQCACSKLRLRRRKPKRERHNGRESRPAANTDTARREEQQVSKMKAHVERLVNEMVKRSTSLFSSDPNADEPSSLLLLRRMSSESDDVLIEIQLALVRCIPLDLGCNPFGTNLLVLVLDECSLFSIDVLTRLIRELRLSSLTVDGDGQKRLQVRRNTCVLLGTLAEKLAGPNSAALCTEEILHFLFGAVAECTAPDTFRLDSARLNVALHALIALEKLAHANATNKAAIWRRIYERNELASLTTLAELVRVELERFHTHSPSVLSCDVLPLFSRLTHPPPVRCLPVALLTRPERCWLSDLRQVRFQTDYLLDNVFVRPELSVPLLPPPSDSLVTIPRSTFRFELIDYSRVHARMRNNDLSEYAKLDPVGFEVRSDHNGFETVRASLSVRRTANSRNAYYFEVVLLTNGIMQIGWSTPSSEFHSREGFGVGDDRYSVAFDGCRQLIWFEAKAAACRLPRAPCPVHVAPTPVVPGSIQCAVPPCSCASPPTDCDAALSAKNSHPSGDGDGGWKAGDVLGSLLDLDGSFVAFYVNGVEVTRVSWLFTYTNRDVDEYFAAASLMSFQQALFNVGQLPFLYTPGSCSFRSCFDAAREQFESTASERERACILEQRVVLPRPLFVRARLKQQLDSTRSSAGGLETPKCAVCFEALRPETKCRLTPCGHSEICLTCAMQCELCPFCRTSIEERAAQLYS